MGFGLFVPEFRAAFGLSTSTIGFVSSLGFLGFLLGLLAAQAMLVRRGPEAPVLSGLLAATAGVGMVAAAPGVPVLAAGVFLAASSAGFAWTPFNDAVHRKVRDANRAAALSGISTGTSVGIAGAGIAALVMQITGLSWRACWAAFALASAAALVLNRMALHPVGKSPDGGLEAGWRALLRRAALPLFGIAFVYGTVSAVFIAFAADRVRTAGGVPGLPAEVAPALIFIGYGIFGSAGLLTGRALSRLGLAWLLRLLMAAGAASAALVAILPATWAGLILSSGLQGIHVMMTSAVLAFWSERLFPALPSTGFTAALLATAAGSVLGPAAAGLASDAFGAAAMFLGTALLPAATVLLLRERHLRLRPAPAPGA